MQTDSAFPKFFYACLIVVLLTAPGLSASAMSADLANESGDRKMLRVCADPNNLPFTNKALEGFENRLAELVADELGLDGVAYTWHAQRRGFIRQTLDAGKCDVIMGVPNLEMIDTTRAYYRSTYVFVSRKDRGLDFSSMNSPRLKQLSIGVHLIGDDGSNIPPAHALGERGIVENVVGYSIYGDYSQDSPPSRLIKAVANGEVDIAAVWGPLAGYYAKRSPVPLRVVPITDTLEYLPLMFQYPISMGVRDGDLAMKNRLNEVIHRRQKDIQALLERYGVPLVGS